MAKVKNDFSDTEKIFKEWKRLVRQNIAPVLESAIIDESISKGISPVKGARKFKRYSESYKEQIREGAFSELGKKERPVNMELTGEMLESFKVTSSQDKIRVEFRDEKAVFHDSGSVSNNLPQRKLLPSRSGEKFSVKIQDSIQSFLEKILEIARRRFN